MEVTPNADTALTHFLPDIGEYSKRNKQSSLIRPPVASYAANAGVDLESELRNDTIHLAADKSLVLMQIHQWLPSLADVRDPTPPRDK